MLDSRRMGFIVLLRACL